MLCERPPADNRPQSQESAVLRPEYRGSPLHLQLGSPSRIPSSAQLDSSGNSPLFSGEWKKSSCGHGQPHAGPAPRQETCGHRPCPCPRTFCARRISRARSPRDAWPPPPQAIDPPPAISERFSRPQTLLASSPLPRFEETLPLNQLGPKIPGQVGTLQSERWRKSIGEIKTKTVVGHSR